MRLLKSVVFCSPMLLASQMALAKTPAQMDASELSLAIRAQTEQVRTDRNAHNQQRASWEKEKERAERAQIEACPLGNCNRGSSTTTTTPAMRNADELVAAAKAFQLPQARDLRHPEKSIGLAVPADLQKSALSLLSSMVSLIELQAELNFRQQSKTSRRDTRVDLNAMLAGNLQTSLNQVRSEISPLIYQRGNQVANEIRLSNASVDNRGKLHEFNDFLTKQKK